jgi:hypothetical protein
VASGKKAALAIHEHISGTRPRLDKSEEHCELPGNQVWHPVDYEKVKRRPVPAVSTEKRLKSATVIVEQGFAKIWLKSRGPMPQLRGEHDLQRGPLHPLRRLRRCLS